MAASPSAPPRIANIDALRGVAAFMVFVFHVQFFAGFDKRALPPLTLFGHEFTSLPNPGSFGASGVNLFFVISGFVLTHQRLQRLARGAEVPLGEYLRGRFARITPPYWAAVFVALVSTSVLRHTFVPEGGASLETDLASHLVFLHVFSRHTYLSLNSVLWSMGIEVQFYLAFPMLLIALRRAGPRRFAAAAFALALAWRYAMWLAFKDAPGGIGQISLASLWMSQLPGRIPEFALGMVLAQLYASPAARTAVARGAGLAACAAFPIAAWGRAAGPPWAVDALLGIFYACLFAWVVFPERARLAPAWLTRFGVMSYSFFLIHEPVADWFGPPLGHLFKNPYLALVPVIGICGVACVFVSAVFFRLVEEPASRWSRAAAPRGSSLQAGIDVLPTTRGDA